MEEIIVQLGDKHTQIAELVRSQGDDICIGRGFNNTLVLTDEYVAPQQIRIYRKQHTTADNQVGSQGSQGAWFLEILDDTNGVLLNGKRVTTLGVHPQLKSNDRLTLGRTNLTLWSAVHPVEPTRKLFSRRLHQDSFGLWLPVGVLLGVAGLDITLEHFLASPRDNWTEFASEVAVLSLIISLWASLWGLLGRLFRQQGHFPQQLLSTSIVVGGLSLLAPWSDIIEFSSSSASLASVFDYGLAFLALAMLLRFNLLFATNIRKTSWVAGTTSALLVGLFAANNGYKAQDFSPNPDYTEVLKPAWFHPSQVQSVDDYFNALTREFETLEFETRELRTLNNQAKPIQAEL